ncbi:bifunctional (p)ppGpp synthetase/guanosine-3',5'-bis(diphosphate) 3'-pyrophosphohydrolase, partial [bacterium]
MSGDVGGPIGLAPSGQTQTLDSLLVRLTGYLPPEVDLDPVRLAYRWAERGHAGQQRLSGEPYLVHPLAVAHVLADLHLDRETVVAGLLHDVVEDTPITLEEVSEEFGLEVAALVDGVTKLSQIRFRSMEEEQANNLRKMLLAMAKDVRVILIKLADRLHNMRTLRFLPADRRQEIARETVEIFAPLAHRLGISQIKWELEDLSFRTLEPEVYQALRERVSARRRERQEFIDRVITTLRQELSRAGIEAEVDGRPKNFYSIYRKMQRGREFEEIFDLNAIRIR